MSIALHVCVFGCLACQHTVYSQMFFILLFAAVSIRIRIPLFRVVHCVKLANSYID